MTITYNTNGPLQKAEKLEKAAEVLRELGESDPMDALGRVAYILDEEAQKLKREWCRS